jgi:hypothetical protein
MNVAVHNPSTVDLSVAKIAVPIGEYVVTAFDDQSQQFVKVDSTFICYVDRTEEGNEIQSCFLSVNKTTESRSFSLLTIERTGDLKTSPQQPLKEGDSISCESFDLVFVGLDAEDSSFKLLKKSKLSDHQEILKVSLRNWSSYKILNQFHLSEQQDGDYIFRPLTGMFEPWVYS